MFYIIDLTVIKIKEMDAELILTVKVPIIPDFIDNFAQYIFHCKLENLTLTTFYGLYHLCYYQNIAYSLHKFWMLLCLKQKIKNNIFTMNSSCFVLVK